MGLTWRLQGYINCAKFVRYGSSKKKVTYNDKDSNVSSARTFCAKKSTFETKFSK